jgi:hypothetical protein
LLLAVAVAVAVAVAFDITDEVIVISEEAPKHHSIEVFRENSQFSRRKWSIGRPTVSQ